MNTVFTCGEILNTDGMTMDVQLYMDTSVKQIYNVPIGCNTHVQQRSFCLILSFIFLFIKIKL